MRTLTGRAAIEHARRTGAQLHAYSDPASEGGPVSLAEAEERVAIDPSLVYLPLQQEGWLADDGNFEVAYPTAESAEDAAHEYVASGSWYDDDDSDVDILVYVWPRLLDSTGRVVPRRYVRDDLERHVVNTRVSR